MSRSAAIGFVLVFCAGLLRARNAPVFSFPSCTWERLLILAKLRFALLGPYPVARSIALGFILLAVTPLLRAQDAPEVVDNDTSPYHVALVDYKSGDYGKALVAIKAAIKANPNDDIPTDILYARILTELRQYDAAEKWLRSMYAPSPPEKLNQDANVLQVELALADLLLRKHSFDRAAKYYSLALQAQPNDPDLILDLVYTSIGSSDLITAGKYASQLKPVDPAHDPLDPKHPGNPSYYFAKAALAQATGNSQGADDSIQNARTIYGITVTNRYLKTYLEVFAPSAKTTDSDITPPPLLQNPSK